MSKNKDIYGVVRKSQPIPNPSTELTENLSETNRRDRECNTRNGFRLFTDEIPQPVKKAARKPSIKKANFLFFLSFVCFALLTMPTTLWADLISLTVDSGGDNRFRGEVDRLRIIFTVDDSDDEDPYIVEVVKMKGSGDNVTFNSLGVIEQGDRVRR